MSLAPNISSFERVIPMIYAYTHPDVPSHAGWTKIGYTEKQSVNDRIRQQNQTADIAWELLWQDNAMYKDGSGQYFTDHDFHRYLERRKNIERQPNTEWFHIDGTLSRAYFDSFASRQPDADKTGFSYNLREEQARAVSMTKAYFELGGTEFLWNAKPRFGKTLTACDLVRSMGFKRVLIVTNRPSIANSWADDFNKFIGWRGELCFVSETDALKDHEGVLSREEYLAAVRGKGADAPGMVAFISLQDLKGSVYFGGQYRKLDWMAKEYTDAYGVKQHGMAFDLLIIDESQEGVDTMRTERAFRNIDRKHTLYLSGTPFKQLASDQFSAEQIFNWSYADEQEAKAKWNGEDYNPYESLPTLNMFTYQLSGMIYDEIKRGVDLSDDGDTVDYAFDLNEFFATNESGKLIHEEEIKKFLRALTTQEKYPFSTPALRRELAHTMWYLNRVASAKALKKLLNEDEVFKEYEVVLAVGDGRAEDDERAAEAAFDRVRKAIAEHEKTITLTVGQLTVGVTVPEWSGVLMLCNMQSPSSYMQAAFRAQNPCMLTVGGQRFRKENAYVFDFDPARTLIIFDKFANNLSPDTVAGRGTGEQREKNIKRLLNFFPVLGEDDEGRMVELDAKAVLSIPRKLKSVVDSVKETVKAHVVEPVTGAYEVKKATQNRVERQVEREIDSTFEKLHDDYVQQANIAKAEFSRAQDEAKSEAEVKQAEAAYHESLQNALQTFTETVKTEVQRTIEEKPKELVEQLERHKAEEEKRGIEDDIRAHLRGFARTIPSFIMAYGDDGLTLANFDEYTEDDVFLEVTGITHDNFRFLRDGGDYPDPDTGETEHFDGHLFDEVVFNDSIREFLRKKQELADYFDESHEEDIFDYIPPQKTNQIFTPKWVVQKMVDELEANNPGCFDDPDKTFADLYMKSGLYITEIVKRLYRSEKMKVLIPDDKARILHILDKQVYGMAPTRIIYLIATNYILGFDEALKGTAAHFVQADAAEASKTGTLAEVVEQAFGE